MGAISPKAFEHFFKQQYRPLCLFALHYTANAADAEDIVQQAFLEVWNQIAANRAIENLKAYMYRSVRNQALTFIANHPASHFDESTSILDASASILDESASILDESAFGGMSEEEQIFCAERDARLWKAIDALPAERRRIFLLAKRDGMRYREIADELKISVKTVENQMTKALKTLRDTAVNIYHYFF